LKHALAFCVLLTLVLSSSSPAFSQSGNFSYDKAILCVEVSGDVASGATTEIQTEVYNFLIKRLSESYDIRPEHSAEGDKLLLTVDLALAKGPDYNRKAKVHNYMLSANLHLFKNMKDQMKKGGVVGGAGSGDKQQCRVGAIADLVSKIVTLCNQYFPIYSTIRDIDGDTVHLDQGTTAGIKTKMYCDVYDESGKAVGVIRITKASTSSSTGKIIKGRGNLDFGDTIHTRSKGKAIGGIIEVFSVPMETAPGAKYEELVGLGDYQELTVAQAVRAAAYGKFSDGTTASLGGGIMITDEIVPLFFDLALGYEAPISFDLLSLTLKLRGGAILIPGREYIKLDEYQEGSGSVPVSDTGPNNQWFWGVGGGLKLHLGSNVALNAELGYLQTGKGDDWSYTQGEGENAESIEVDPTWVDYDHITFKGVCLRAGLTVFWGYEEDWFWSSKK
jgi:hypothetical protein